MSSSFLISDMGVSQTAKYFGITHDELMKYIEDGAVTSDDVFRRIKGAPYDWDENPVKKKVSQKPPKTNSPWGRKWF